MVGSAGLSTCYTSRRRLTAITTLSALITTIVLVNNFAYNSVSVTSAEVGSHRRSSFVREDRLSAAHTQGISGRSSRPSTGHTQATSGRSSNCSLRGIRKFPSALIIGVRKGGTRALIDMLKCHPDIVTAVSEVHYFDRDENFAKGIQWYINHMPPSTTGQIAIEKSPSYFVSPSAAERIHIVSPHTKIILIVRNPLDRIVSDYTQLLRKGGSKHVTFEGNVFHSPSGEVNAAFYPVSTSMYDVHFERWLKHFDLSGIHIVNGDALIRDPAAELKKVEDFLEVEEYFHADMFYFNATKGFYCWKKSNTKSHQVPYCLGSAKGHHLPQLSSTTVQRLQDFLRPHNERFFKQAKQRFSWDTSYGNIGPTSIF